MGSGVAGAIKARGGAEIEREAMAHAPVEPGESVVTGGGSLRARFVIHAAVMGQDLRTDERLVARATFTALECGAARGLESVALPALGTGVGGCAVDTCAEAMLASVERHAAATARVRRIRFVLFGSQAFRTFSAAAERVTSRNAGPIGMGDPAIDRSPGRGGGW
jgi:O-acetyl-ADP-ribose deacetylase (regulator of RNase III)